GVLAAAVEVGVHNLLAVEDHDHAAAVGADGQGVPLPRGLAGPARRRHDVVDRPGVLVEVEFRVAGVVVVQDLDLHADAADVPLLGGADLAPAVAARPQAVFQAQLEVGVVAFRAQPAPAPAPAHEQSALGGPGVLLAGVLLPAGQVLAVEQRDEA